MLRTRSHPSWQHSPSTTPCHFSCFGSASEQWKADESSAKMRRSNKGAVVNKYHSINIPQLRVARAHHAHLASLAATMKKAPEFTPWEKMLKLAYEKVNMRRAAKVSSPWLWCSTRKRNYVFKCKMRCDRCKHKIALCNRC